MSIQPLLPHLGAIKAEITESNFVIVKVYKFDTIRQAAYWAVVKGTSRDFKTRERAEAYAQRMRAL